jgi:hypothetical protein
VASRAAAKIAEETVLRDFLRITPVNRSFVQPDFTWRKNPRRPVPPEMTSRIVPGTS